MGEERGKGANKAKIFKNITLFLKGLQGGALSLRVGSGGRALYQDFLKTLLSLQREGKVY